MTDTMDEQRLARLARNAQQTTVALSAALNSALNSAQKVRDATQAALRARGMSEENRDVITSGTARLLSAAQVAEDHIGLVTAIMLQAEEGRT